MDEFEDFENVTENVTLEQTEDATYRTKKDFFGREQVLSYPYSSAEDFKKLTPEQIVTRRIKLINPNVEAGQATKKILSEPQRQSLLRLMAIKKNVELMPKEKQEKMRANMISSYEMSKPGSEAIEYILDDARLAVSREKTDKEIEDMEDERLRSRIKALKEKGGSRKTKKSRKTNKSRKTKKSKKSNKSRKSMKSRKTMKPKSRKLVKN
jgi:hypothetical protein